MALIGLSKEHCSIPELLSLASYQLSFPSGSPSACIFGPGPNSPALGEQGWNPSIDRAWLSSPGANLSVRLFYSYFCPQAVAAVGARMDSLLSAPDILLLPATRLLLSSQHRKQVTQHAFTRLHEVYVQLYKAVQDPTNAFQPGLLPRSPDQIAALLQI